MRPFLQTHPSFPLSLLRVLTLSILCFLTSCGNWGCSGNSGASAYQTSAPQDYELHKTRSAALPEAEKRADVEHELRINTEKRLQKQETTTSHWQSMSFILCVSAGLLLILGAALGSSARHDAEKK